MVALSADQVVRLCTEIEHVSWVKEEVPPSTHSISNLMAKNSPAVKGVMGGAGGRYLITERDARRQGLHARLRVLRHHAAHLGAAGRGRAGRGGGPL